MSTGEVMYEISRYDVSTDTEFLIGHARLVQKGDDLWQQSADGSEIRCSGTVEAEIEGDSTLSEVRANEVTRIIAGDDALRVLPLLLRVPGDSSDFDETRWSQSMRDTHLDDSLGVQRGVYRVLYVNGNRWGAFETTDGQRLLPDGDWGEWSGYNGKLPSLDGWGKLTFGESASRTYGLDIATIGLATPGVVVCAALPDEREAEIRLDRRGDDVETFLNWLFHGSLTEDYFSWGSSELGEALLAQLFVEVIDGGVDSVIAGDYLAAGLDIDPDLAMMGIYRSSEWTLDVRLDESIVEAILDRLAARGGRLRDIVTAARDPNSPAAKVRRAAVRALEQSGD